MGVFKKTALSVKTEKTKTCYTAFALNGDKKGVLRADESMNCDIRDGVLRGGLGGTEMYTDDGKYKVKSSGLPIATHFFLLPGLDGLDNPTEQLGALGDNNGVFYTYDKYTTTWVLMQTFSSRMKGLYIVDVNGVKSSVIIGATGLYLFTFGKAMKSTSWKNLGAKAHLACFQQGRLFFIQEPHTLRYSAPYDAANLEQSIKEGGGIQLPSHCGEIVDLAAFDGKVYIFYQEGIACVEPAGAACDFKVKELPYRHGLIFSGSVGECGKKLFFLNENGVFCIENDEVKEVCKNLSLFPLRGDQVCNHGSFSGQYAVTYEDISGVDKCVVVDAETEDGYFSFVPSRLSDYKGGAVACCDGYLWHLFRGGKMPSVGKRAFVVNDLKFGGGGARTLERLELIGAGSVKVTVKSGSKSKTFTMAMTGGRAEKDISLHGKTFSLRLELQDNAYLSGLNILSSQFVKKS